MNGYLYLFTFILSLSVYPSIGKENNYFFYTYINSSNQIAINGSNKQMNPVNVPAWTSQAFYNASQNQSGWDILEVLSNPAETDETQAYHAGYIEGYLTRQQIWNYYWNALENITSNHSNKANEYLKQYYDDNNKYIDQMIRSANGTDPFWYQVNLIYKQIQGILDGYNNATKDQNLPLNFYFKSHDILFLHFLDELPEIVESVETRLKKNGTSNHEKPKGKHQRHPGRAYFADDFGSHCSALIKVLPGNSDVFIGHDTWTGFTRMNRIIKRYKLPFKVSANSTEIIPGMKTAFSSYPGTVASVDDFYVMGSGIVTLETTNSINNMSMLLDIHPVGQVPEEVRNIVANRLAKDGKSWESYFKLNNSGTYNNQWMIVDLNKFRPGFDPEDGFLRILEQAPNLIISADQTTHILQHGYWASYNIPFYSEMYKITGNEAEAKNDSWFSYSECPRAKMFTKEQIKVVDMDSMIWLMRYNNYKNDPYSVCSHCSPKPNACNAIASRCDLNPVNGNYSIRPLSPMLFGATDVKIVSFSLFSQGEFLAIGGPTSQNQPPFAWSKTKLDTKYARHMGQPDEWDFQPIYSNWILPYCVSCDIDQDPDDDSPFDRPSKKNNGAFNQPLSFVLYFLTALCLALMANK